MEIKVTTILVALKTTLLYHKEIETSQKFPHESPQDCFIIFNLIYLLQATKQILRIDLVMKLSFKRVNL